MRDGDETYRLKGTWKAYQPIAMYGPYCGPDSNKLLKKPKKN